METYLLVYLTCFKFLLVLSNVLFKNDLKYLFGVLFWPVYLQNSSQYLSTITLLSSLISQIVISPKHSPILCLNII